MSQEGVYNEQSIAVNHTLSNPWNSILLPLLPQSSCFSLWAPTTGFTCVHIYTVSALCRPVGVPPWRLNNDIYLVIHWSNMPLVLTAARRRPGGVRQQAKAAIPMVESMLRELKQRPELQGPLQGEVIDQVQLCGSSAPRPRALRLRLRWPGAVTLCWV